MEWNSMLNFLAAILAIVNPTCNTNGPVNAKDRMLRFEIVRTDVSRDKRIYPPKIPIRLVVMV